MFLKRMARNKDLKVKVFRDKWRSGPELAWVWEHCQPQRHSLLFVSLQSGGAIWRRGAAADPRWHPDQAQLPVLTSSITAAEGAPAWHPSPGTWNSIPEDTGDTGDSNSAGSWFGLLFQTWLLDLWRSRILGEALLASWAHLWRGWGGVMCI